MKRIISKGHLLLLFSYVLFVAHSSAKPVSESFRNEFIAHRQRQREARLSAKTDSSSSYLATHSFVDNADNNWAGAQQLSVPSGKVNSVSAQWSLPQINLPPPTANYGPSNWSQEVGIDLTASCTTILSAGTTTYVLASPSGTVTGGAIAHYRWGDSGFELPEIAVSPGDSVEFNITTASNSTAMIVVNNLSTGNITLIGVSSPDAASNLCGLSAYWLTTNELETGNVVPYQVFSNFSFQNCAAATTTSVTLDLTNATLVNMVQNATTLFSASVVNTTELLLSYV